jgi:flagellar motor switch protein FliM
MATPTAAPPKPADLVRSLEPGPGREALVPAATPQYVPLTNPLIARLPVELEVGIPVPSFRVRNLLALDSGSLVKTQWEHSEEVPLRAGEVQLAWSEFEVIETRLAVRVTRLA